MHDIPYSALINFDTGVIAGAEQITERRLSDMPGYYRDGAAVERLLADDPLLYRVYLTPGSGADARWNVGVSVIEPGCVGDEYFMTKGHYHRDEAAPEVYTTLSGAGQLLLQTRSGEAKALAMTPGAVNYIPGEWAHRTVNTGDEPLVFLAVWPSDAGYDYGTIAERGFARLVLAGDDGPQIVVNPGYEPER